MTKKTYWEKLKDPRWQKKRLIVLQERDFRCEVCGDDKSTLHVHHKQYFKGREPWEYENVQLAVLCEKCHSSTHDGEDALNLMCSYLMMDGPDSRDSIASLISGLLWRQIPPPFVYDQVAYWTGRIADVLLMTWHKSSAKELELIGEVAIEHADEMYQYLLAFARAKAAE